MGTATRTRVHAVYGTGGSRARAACASGRNGARCRSACLERVCWYMVRLVFDLMENLCQQVTELYYLSTLS